jgi:hypothetical protein
MHVYLRDQRVRLRMVQVDGQGLVPDGSDLIPMAFYAAGNQNPSFRALLPPDTIGVLRDALDEPVTLGVLAEEPDDSTVEIRAMVGLAVPIDKADLSETDGEEDNEPWRASVSDPEAWRGDSNSGYDEAPTRTALLAFAPLVRIRRRFPHNFGEELADLLESALSGGTRPAIEARVDRLLEDL